MTSELVLVAFERAMSVVLDMLGAVGLVETTAPHQRRLWREAARAAGLDRIEQRRQDLVGWSGTLWVQLSALGERGAGGTALAISGRGIPENLTVRPEVLGTTLQGLAGARELEIGDEAFDRDAWIEGSPAATRVVLDAGMRRTMGALFRGVLEVEPHGRFWVTGRVVRGVLRIEVPVRSPAAPRPGERTVEGLPLAGEVYLDGEEKLPRILPAALALAERLRPPRDVGTRLAQNLAGEPEARVRGHLLMTLLREFPQHPATHPAVVRSLRDPDAEVRLRAGIALGEEGREVLLSLAKGEGAEDAVNARAVAALGSRLDLPEVQEVLAHSLRTRRIATASACLHALSATDEGEAVATLARVLAVEKGELAVIACEALGAATGTSAEAPLLRALAHAAVPVRVAAARALGNVGTSAAVLPLRDAERTGGEIRRAAREAVARIQVRLAGTSGAAPGQLSLAAGERGQVSLVPPDERGRLAIVEGSGDGE